MMSIILLKFKSEMFHTGGEIHKWRIRTFEAVELLAFCKMRIHTNLGVALQHFGTNWELAAFLLYAVCAAPLFLDSRVIFSLPIRLRNNSGIFAPPRICALLFPPHFLLK